MRHPRQLQSSLTFSAIVSTILLFPCNTQAQDPQALSVPFGPDFLGYDGLWSPAQIRVGTPEQYLLVLPSTTSSETWVAGPRLCTDATCASRRGGIFYSGNSTTWDPLGQYELGFSALSEATQGGAYGFDSIAISDTLSASNQVIAVVDNVEQWNGQLGMGVGATRFQNNTNYLAFLSTLVQNNSAIPSHSYSYTAGASYKGSGTAGSLTLGGADTSRYTPNNFWFTLASGYIPSVAVKSIQVSSTLQQTNWSSNPLPLFAQSQAAMFNIDSSTPYLWLPEAVCDTIAETFGLSWNPDVELYVLDTMQAQDLTDMGLEFTFNLATSVDSNEMIALKLSYDAFNLQLSYPYPGLFSAYSDDKVAYFPIRRANNTLQYTIGRAFLQEIYLIVDYERNSFSLSQALFPDSNQDPTLARISRPDDSVWAGPVVLNKASGLSTAAKAGIGVAIALGICVLAASVWFCCLRKRRAGSSDDNEKTPKNSIFSRFSKGTRKDSASTSAAELNADKQYPTEMNSDTSNSRFELSTSTPIEMAAGEVAPTFFQERNNARIAQKNDPRSPVELTQPPSRSSIGKDGLEARVTEQRPDSTVPPYSPGDINQGLGNTLSSSGNGVSSYTTRMSTNPSHGGSDHIISPITGYSSEPNHSSRGNPSPGGSDSSRRLSPVSPVQARSEGQGSTRSISRPENLGQIQATTSSTNRASLSPIPDNSRFPRRSPSRDSRFREELTEEQSTATGASEPPQRDRPNRPGVRISRFSWEG